MLCQLCEKQEMVLLKEKATTHRKDGAARDIHLCPVCDGSPGALGVAVANDKVVSDV